MTTEILLLSFISLALLFLLIECATEGIDALRFFSTKTILLPALLEKNRFPFHTLKDWWSRMKTGEGISLFAQRRIRIQIIPIFFHPVTGCTGRKRFFQPWSGERKAVPGGLIIPTPENGQPAHRSLCAIMLPAPGNTLSGTVFWALASC